MGFRWYRLTPAFFEKDVQQRLVLLKFRFSKKATKFETISHMIWRLLSKCQIKWEIVSNFLWPFQNVRTLPNQCDFLTEFSFTGQIRQLGEATYNTNGRESSVVFTWLLQLRCIGLTPSKGSRPARNYCRLTSKLCKMEKLWSYGKNQIFH